MRKLLIGFIVSLFLVIPCMAEMPNLYGGPAYNITDEAWCSGIASDIIGKWAFSATVGIFDDGAKAVGIGVDIGKVATACKMDYLWGKVSVKIVYLPARDFDKKEWTHRILGAMIEL